jgi:hypothetical protein
MYSTYISSVRTERSLPIRLPNQKHISKEETEKTVPSSPLQQFILQCGSDMFDPTTSQSPHNIFIHKIQQRMNIYFANE